MSNPTISQLRAWAANSHALADAATQIDAAIDVFDTEMNTLTRDVEVVSESWHGESARASQAAADSERQFSNRLGIAVLDIADDINRLGPAFVRACAAATNSADSIAGLGYVVSENGGVAAPRNARGGFPADVPVGIAADDAVTQASANAEVHQRTLRRELAEAGVADADLAGQISATVDALSRASERATTPAQVGRDVRRILEGMAELPRNPWQLKDFWDSLTVAEKAELWNHDRAVGNLDGIPVADRDHFNRRHLVEMQRAERARIRTYTSTRPYIVDGAVRRSPGPGGYVTENRRQKEFDSVTMRYRALKSLENALRSNAGAAPRLLMRLDDRGHVAVAVNNPDTADNVATYVPGVGSDLGSVSRGISRSEAMLNAADRADPTATNSVIAWYAYDAPQSLIAASGPAHAAHAAAALDAFQSGLRATHDGAGASHNSVLGHSYGTVVVGEAASEGHTLDADDLVFVASPGVGGPDSPDDLNLTGVSSRQMAEHVFATTAANDPIGAAEGIHGPSPADPRFSARVFTSDAGTPRSTAAHSEYWDVHPDGTESRSLTAMGLIIAGRGDEAR